MERNGHTNTINVETFIRYLFQFESLVCYCMVEASTLDTYSHFITIFWRILLVVVVVVVCGASHFYSFILSPSLFQFCAFSLYLAHFVISSVLSLYSLTRAWSTLCSYGAHVGCCFLSCLSHSLHVYVFLCACMLSRPQSAQSFVI